MSNIICFDQSSRISGYSVWDYTSSTLVDYGKFEASQQDMSERLLFIRNKLILLIDKYQPVHLYFEDIQLQTTVGNNVVTYKALAEVIGVCIELAKERGIPYTLVPSVTWKSKCGVRGKQRAEQKRAAQQLVFDRYNLKCTQDEADSICIGIYACGEQLQSQNPHDWTT